MCPDGRQTRACRGVGNFSKTARSMLRHTRVVSKDELERRILAYLDDLNRDPVGHSWTYQIGEAA